MKTKSSRLSLFATIITMLIGILVLIDWFTHNDFLKYFIADTVKMKFNPALCFVFSSVVLLLHYFPGKNKIRDSISVLLSVIVSLTGLLTLIEYIFDYNLGIDEFFVHDELSTTAVYYAGRMSPIAAANLLLIGVGLLLLDNEKTTVYQFLYLFGIVFTALLMLIGFNFLSDIPAFMRMAIHAAIGFILLAVAIYFAQPMWRKKISFELQLFTGFIAAIILMTLSSLIFFYYNNERNTTSQLVEHTKNVLHEVEETFSITKDFESGSRGYVITGDSNYLEHYTIAKATIFAHIKKLKGLTVNDPSQQIRIDSLSMLIDKRITFSQQSIQLRNKKGFKAASELIATMQGKFYMDRIRNLVREIEHEENNLLINRQEQNNKNIAAINRALIVFLSSAFILLVIIFFALRYNLVRSKKAEKQSRESEDQIQTIFNAAPDPVIVIDEEGKIVKWNPNAETLFGWTEQEVLGKSLNDTIIPQSYQEAHTKGLAHFLETGEGPILRKSIEIVALKKNQTELNVSLKISPTTIKNKYFFIGFIRDITEQKKAEEKKVMLLNELEKANTELETFNYSVSHDLKSPLRTITNFLQVFLKKYGNNQEEGAVHILDIINRKTQRMGELIDDLLNFSRLGKKELEIHFINMNRLIKHVIEEQKHLHHLEIKRGKLDNCYGDDILLQQVWDNLISNAVKYSRTREKQHIEIGSCRQGSEVVYWIKDNGVGFEMEYVSKLFEVFQRLHDPSEFEGTGIGLALSKRIIEKHGGRIWAESKVNEGAVFYFSIPANGSIR